MKTLLVLCFLSLGACAHETTTMDRELALKLADRPQVIVASSPAPIVNVNIGSNGSSGGSGGSGGISAAPMTYIPEAPLEDTRTNCMESPIYNSSGKLLRMQRHCFGGN